MPKALPSSSNGPSFSFLDSPPPLVKASLNAHHILPGTMNNPWLFMGFEYEYYYHFFLLFPPSIPIHVASQQRNADSLRSKTAFSSCIIWDTVTQPPAEQVASTCVQGGKNWVSEPNWPKSWWALVKKPIKCIFWPTTVLGGHGSFLQILETKQSAVPKG